MTPTIIAQIVGFGATCLALLAVAVTLGRVLETIDNLRKEVSVMHDMIGNGKPGVLVRKDAFALVVERIDGDVERVTSQSAGHHRILPDLTQRLSVIEAMERDS